MQNRIVAKSPNGDKSGLRVKKAVAHAMRHSTTQQGGAAYDKERVERLWASAVNVAGKYAARFE